MPLDPLWIFIVHADEAWKSWPLVVNWVWGPELAGPTDVSSVEC